MRSKLNQEYYNIYNFSFENCIMNIEIWKVILKSVFSYWSIGYYEVSVNDIISF